MGKSGANVKPHRFKNKGVKKRPAAMKRRPGLFYSPKKKANNQAMRNLVQDDFEKICKFSEAQCKSVFTKAKVLPSRKELNDRWCWKCHHKMTLDTSTDILRCTAKKCQTRVYNASIAYTPFYNSNSGGHTLTHKTLLKYAFAVGVRTPQDAMKQYVGTSTKHSQRTDQDLRAAVAFIEKKKGDRTAFQNGEVDIDGVSTGVDRTVDDQTTFKGRFVLYKERASKNTAWVPIPDKVAKKGKKNLGPEHYETDLKSHYTSKMLDGSLHSSDAGTALKKAAKKASKPAVHAVHSKGEYVKESKILLSSMTGKEKAVVMKRPAAVTSRYYHTLAGSQSCEGAFGNTKQSKRRTNMTGRQSGANAHVNSLSAFRLMQEPGTATVLKALAVYREWASDNISPQRAFGPKKDKTWLWKSI